jgi:hypothetical protein
MQHALDLAGPQQQLVLPLLVQPSTQAAELLMTYNGQVQSTVVAWSAVRSSRLRVRAQLWQCLCRSTSMMTYSLASPTMLLLLTSSGAGEAHAGR